MYRQTGLTLLELLVVFAVLSLFLAISTPYLVSAVERSELNESIRQMATDIVKTKRQAVLTQQPMRFHIDLLNNSYKDGEHGPEKRLADEISITVTTIEEEVIKDRLASIRFFPDGSSTGGVIDFVYQDQRKSILIDWMTGRVNFAK